MARARIRIILLLQPLAQDRAEMEKIKLEIFIISKFIDDVYEFHKAINLNKNRVNVSPQLFELGSYLLFVFVHKHVLPDGFASIGQLRAATVKERNISNYKTQLHSKSKKQQCCD